MLWVAFPGYRRRISMKNQSPTPKKKSISNHKHVPKA